MPFVLETVMMMEMMPSLMVVVIWKLDNGNEDDDDDKEPCAWPPVWENGFKPPPDSSFMFLR